MSKICRNCGSWQDDSAKFCEECGNPLAELSAPVIVEAEPEFVEAEQVDVIIEPRRQYDSPAADAREVRERLVGTKTEYYLPRFEQMETLNSYTSWNWAAFLFSTAWMMYRKMYVFGIVVWLASNLVSLLGGGLLSLLLSVGVGVLGNYLYMKDIDNRTEKAMDLQPEQREMFIQKNSGTSWVGVIVLFVLSMVFSGIFY